jgi:hypothetical protein
LHLSIRYKVYRRYRLYPSDGVAGNTPRGLAGADRQATTTGADCAALPRMPRPDMLARPRGLQLVARNKILPPGLIVPTSTPSENQCGLTLIRASPCDTLRIAWSYKHVAARRMRPWASGQRNLVSPVCMSEKLLARIRSQLGVTVPIQAVFAAPSVDEMAPWLSDRSGMQLVINCPAFVPQRQSSASNGVGRKRSGGSEWVTTSSTSS